MDKPSPAPSERTRVKRLHERGRYDATTLYAILDATPMCSVGYVIDGMPFVTPTLQWRDGDHVYWHGSSASRALRSANEANVCLTVSLLDGFVLARSGMHHSMNYRSAMLLGKGTKIIDPDRKEALLAAFVDRQFPGRWASLRAMTQQELKATSVLSMPIDEASAKIRTGMPIDDEEDYDVPVWAGVLPVRMEVQAPQPDPRNLPGMDTPTFGPTPKLG